MANICSFSAKIVGGKKKQTQKAYDIIANKQKNIICGRGFYTLSEEPEIKEEEEKFFLTFDGECKWSVWSAAYDTAESMKNTPENWSADSFKGVDLILNILDVSKVTETSIEFFSTECGMCFSEHILIENGEIKTFDVSDYYEICVEDYQSKKDAEEDLEIEISDEKWETEEYIAIGEPSYEFSI